MSWGIAMATPHVDSRRGTEQQCLRLAAELARHGCRPFIVTGRSPATAAPVLVDGVPIVRVSPSLASRLRRVIGSAARSGPTPPAHPASRAPAGLVASLRTLAARAARHATERADERRLVDAILSRGRPDIVHLHGVFWAPMLRAAAEAAKQAGSAFVVKITNEAERTWRILEGHQGALAALQQADAIVTLNPAMARFFRDRRVGAQVVLIPNGVSVPARAAIDPRGPVIFVGRLDPQKGIDVLLRAWPDVCSRLSDAPELLLVGDGPSRDSLERSASGRVRFLGARDDVPALLAGARLFVLPSRWEGMPNALLEAMGAGLPCVATAVDGTMDVLRAGDEGLLVPPDDPGALAAALTRLLTDPELAARLGERARHRIQRDFSLPAVAGRTRDLYAELLAKRR